MKFFRKGYKVKVLSLGLAFTILFEVIFPNLAWALTSGPKSPEFSSFQPTVITDMVNTFSGDFNYNLPVLDIPGPDGAGYSMSLGYGSGLSPEEEASWVGYGWTLNAGAIDRVVRGFPDEYVNTESNMTYFNRSDPNWTASATATAGLQLQSKREGKKDENKTNQTKVENGQKPGSSYEPSGNSISVSSVLRYNNYQGMQRSYGLSVSAMGVSAGANYSAGGVTYSAAIDPGMILSMFKKKKEVANKPEEVVAGGKKTEVKQITKLQKIAQHNLNKLQEKGSNPSTYMSQMAGSSYGAYIYSDISQSVSIQHSSGLSLDYGVSLAINPSQIPIGIYGGLEGSFNAQKNKDLVQRSVNGFMNSSSGAMDYYMEKGNSFSKRDLFLGIPFANSDLYNVSGEGIAGGFRYVPQETGAFEPENVTNKSAAANFAVRVDVGLNIGVGVDLGGGVSSNAVKSWKPGNSSTFKPGKFRFNNDMGGEALASDQSLENVPLNRIIDIPGIRYAELGSMTDGVAYTNNTNATKRSSYIDYINGQDKFKITNEDGVDYIYSNPSMVLKEASIQTDLDDPHTIENDYLVRLTNSPDNIDYSKIENLDENSIKSYRTLVGERKDKTYASAYPLSEIHNYDYIDANNNGADKADFGGWTKFNYSEPVDFIFRTPYDNNSLLYHPGSLSTANDDAGSVSIGKKEVKYLASVETKTHIAFFVTNVSDKDRFSNAEFNITTEVWNNYMVPAPEQAVERLDAYDASSDKTHNISERLDRIVLFSKSRMDKPLRTVRFEYSNELCTNLPNADIDPQTQKVAGKLTLKKVWLEYEGISNARISPYIFEYNYPRAVEFADLDAAEAKNKSFMDLTKKYSYGSENPAYKPWLLDAWGNLQFNAEIQQQLRRTWLSQLPDQMQQDPNKTGLNASGKGSKFDPAAWHLKQIKLPSGGIIIAEYEQKDYRFVQDRGVMAMASIYQSDFSDYNDMSFLVNPEDLGYTEGVDLEDWLQRINDYFGSDGLTNKMYFKLLFSRNGAQGSNPGFGDGTVEYITGYGQLVPQGNSGIVSMTGNKLKFIIKGSTIEGSTLVNKTTSPRQAAYDFFSTQRVGIDSKDYTRFNDQIRGKLDGTGDLQKFSTVMKIGTGIAPEVCVSLVGDMFQLGTYGIPKKDDICKAISQGNTGESRSYLKIPMAVAKKGGGVRVKRLYMYDAGLESGYPELYGNEYIYETADGKSSGVATNEPSGLREENPLITFLPSKTQQGLFSRLTAGIEVENTEGPLGESLLPAPSIGHSRVVVKNIFEGPTSTGFTINEFFTVKDYPFDRYYGNKTELGVATGVDKTSLPNDIVTDKFNLPLPFLSLSLQNSWASQGFRFIVNNMHGQMKKLSSYGGEYKDFQAGLFNKVYMVTGKEYSYFEPGEKVTMLEQTAAGTRNWVKKVPGKEVEVAMEGKKVAETFFNLKLAIKINIGLMFPPPIMPSGNVQFAMNFNNINTYSNSKVIRYPVILKKVIEYRDGVDIVSENMYFNSHNGKPVLVRTTDAYAGINKWSGAAEGDDLVFIDNKRKSDVYTFTVPASWKYSGMGRKDDASTNANLLSASFASYSTYLQEPVVLDNPAASSGVWTFNTQKILSANINTFAQGTTTGIQWLTDDVKADYGDLTAIVDNFNNKWHPNENYVYKGDVRKVSATTDITSAGTINSFVDFNESSPDLSKWIRTNRTTKYSPHGNALEEVNVLGIPSAVKYGYSSNILPVMKASNASYSSIFFNDFETQTLSGLYTTEVSHSGKVSRKISDAAPFVVFNKIIVDDILKKKSAVFRVWVKSTAESMGTPYILAGNARYYMEKVGQAEGWNLFLARIQPLVNTPIGAQVNISFSYPLRTATGEKAYIDDLRFEPQDAASVCYVYDPKSLRLVTQFDSQHFGAFFQYNEEGQLVRKLIETVRGMKTLQETQYNTTTVVKLQ